MQSIHEYNQFRAVIDSIDDLRKQKIPLISGREFYKIMIASVSSPQAYFSGALKKTLEQLKKRQGIHSYRAKILLTGCLTGDMRLIDLIEKTGGLIVADQLCTGSKSGPGSICETGDPIHSIASHYLNKTTCPRMMGKFDDRLKALVKSFEDYRADGVIIETIKFCDMWGIEARQIAVELKKRNIPVLKIDREYRLTAEGQLKTRIQAFLESMNK